MATAPTDLPTSADVPRDPAVLSGLYRTMQLIRQFEERIKAVYHLREMRSPPHLCMGHEAVAVGVCATLDTPDVVYQYYR